MKTKLDPKQLQAAAQKRCREKRKREALAELEALSGRRHAQPFRPYNMIAPRRA